MPILYEESFRNPKGRGKAFPVIFKFDTQTVIINPYGSPKATISAIRVQDIARHLWYSWDNGTWDNAGGAAGNAPVGQSPYITPGTNTLYIAFYATNVGPVNGNVTLTLKDSAGAVLATKTITAVAGATPSEGIEWTGNMPSGTYVVTLSATP